MFLDDRSSILTAVQFLQGVMKMPLFLLHIAFESFRFAFGLFRFDHLFLNANVERVGSLNASFTSNNRMCLSYSFCFVSRLVEMEMTEGISLVTNDFDFLSIALIGGIDEAENEDLFSAANKPPRAGLVRCEVRRSSC